MLRGAIWVKGMILLKLMGLFLGFSHDINCMLKIEIKILYSLPQAKPDSPKYMLLLKNPLFLSNHDKTLSKYSLVHMNPALCGHFFIYRVGQ